MPRTRPVPWGTLAAIDLHDCDRAALADPEVIRRFVPAVIDAIGMRAHGPLHLERFGDGDLEGWSAMQFIETSSVTLHADEVYGRCFVDVFSCKPFDGHLAAAIAVAVLRWPTLRPGAGAMSGAAPIAGPRSGRGMSLAADPSGGPFASFEHDWAPRTYLVEYFSDVEPDEHAAIAFFRQAMRHVEPGEPMLFFGAGPTLSGVFLAAPHASEIHLADYLPANLREVRRWRDDDPDAHDWTPFVRYTLRCEGIADPTPSQVRARERLTRQRITRLLRCDVRQPDPLGPGGQPAYATVVSPFCADSITDDRAAWRTYLRRIAGLVRPGGALLLAALHRAAWYQVGGLRFPSADIDADDIRDVLEPAFEVADIQTRPVPGCVALGYSGIVLARAHRVRPDPSRLCSGRLELV